MEQKVLFLTAQQYLLCLGASVEVGSSVFANAEENNFAFKTL
jgi:hypothetical protein